MYTYMYYNCTYLHRRRWGVIAQPLYTTLPCLIRHPLRLLLWRGFHSTMKSHVGGGRVALLCRAALDEPPVFAAVVQYLY